jgi:hypothetical protein
MVVGCVHRLHPPSSITPPCTLPLCLPPSLLLPRQAPTPVASVASAFGTVSLQENDLSVSVSLTVTGLSGQTAAHLHLGGAYVCGACVCECVCECV